MWVLLIYSSIKSDLQIHSVPDFGLAVMYIGRKNKKVGETARTRASALSHQLDCGRIVYLAPHQRQKLALLDQRRIQPAAVVGIENALVDQVVTVGVTVVAHDSLGQLAAV